MLCFLSNKEWWLGILSAACKSLLLQFSMFELFDLFSSFRTGFSSILRPIPAFLHQLQIRKPIRQRLLTWIITFNFSHPTVFEIKFPTGNKSLPSKCFWIVNLMVLSDTNIEWWLTSTIRLLKLAFCAIFSLKSCSSCWLLCITLMLKQVIEFGSCETILSNLPKSSFCLSKIKIITSSEFEFTRKFLFALWPSPYPE